MSRLEHGERDEILTRTSLADVARHLGLELRPTGKGRHQALCAFHRERTPSLVLYEDEHFHCFGCGAHGTAIDLVMRSRAVGYREALRLLAMRAGVDLDGHSDCHRAPRLLTARDRAAHEREEILDQLQAIAQRRHEITNDAAGSPALIDFFMDVDDELARLAARELQLLHRFAEEAR